MFRFGGLMRVSIGTMAQPVDERGDHALRGFGAAVPGRHAQARRCVEELVCFDLASDRPGRRRCLEQSAKGGAETLLAMRGQGLEGGVARVQRLRKSMLGRREVDEASHPGRECLEGRMLGGQGVCGIGAGIEFLTEDRSDEIGPPRKVPVHGADPDARAIRDVAHRRIDAAFRKDLLCRLQQGDEIALGVGTDPALRRSLDSWCVALDR